MNDKRLQYPTGFLRRSRQSIACLAVLFCLVGLMPGALWAATTYYVDATGGDDGLGGKTEATAWQTLAKVSGATTFTAGDQILFKRGEVWNESLVIPSSGTVGTPITFGAYGTGDLPLFNGTTTVVWTSAGGGIYSASLPSGDPGLLLYKGASKPSLATLTFNSDTSGIPSGAVLIQKVGAYSSFWVTSVDPTTSGKVYGITFFQDPAKHWVVGQANTIQLRQLVNGREVKSDLTLASGLDVDLQSLQQPGDWYWNSNDNKLYLYADKDPNTIDVKVSTLPTGIESNGEDYLTIQDIRVQGYQETGVHLHRTVGSLVQNMQVVNVGANGHKTGIMLDHSSGNTIQGNLVESVLRVGIGIYAGYSPLNYSQGNTISGNTINNSGSSGISLNTDGLVIPGTSQPMASTVVDNTITGNTILSANRLAYDSAGVYALFVGENTPGLENRIIGQNKIMYGGSKYLRGAGVMIDQGVAPVTITDNFIENNSLGGIVVTGTGHTITGNKITDNGVASWNSAQIVFFTDAENASSCTVRLNTMVATGSRKLFHVDNGSANSSHDINKNTYRGEADNGFCWACGDQWTSFSTWQKQSGHDTNSSFSFITDPPPPDVKSINSTYLLLLK